jgi:nucleotide-binding universal stress UspA family protein
MNATVAETSQLHKLMIFSRVLVGVDGSEESREAGRQAATLAEGKLTLLAVYDIAAGLVGGTGIGVPVYYDEDLQREAAKDALGRAREDFKPANPTGKIAKGVIWDVLSGEAKSERDTLIAVGSGGVGRMVGIVMGSVATEIIHKAPCSVLVARKTQDEFPRRIVVGIDGSPESAAAYAAARELAERFGAELRPVVAHGGKEVDRHLVDLFVDHRLEDLPDDPMTALIAASDEADLLVVGSRGLHGLKALGSVSERVAHGARSSVLIVRQPAWQRVSEELAR